MKKSLLKRLACALFAVVMASRLARAQSAETPTGVPVTMWASANATYAAGEPGSLDINFDALPSSPSASDGAVSLSGGRSTAGGFKTNRVTARLEPGKVYELATDGEFINSIGLFAIPPPGYQIEIAGMVRTAYQFSVPGSYSNHIRVRILLPMNDLAARAGVASSIATGRIYWQVSLGALKNGGSAGSLAIIDAGTSTDWTSLFKPAGLQYESPSTEVYVHRDTTGIRQIIANEAVVDVITNSPTNYELRFYTTDQLQPGTTYPRGLSGDPFVSYTVEQGATATTLKITSKTRNVVDRTTTGLAVARTAETTLTRSDSWPNFSWTLQDWTTSGNSAVVVEDRAPASGNTSTARTENEAMRGSVGGTSVMNVSRSYAAKAWGEAMTSVTAGSSNSLTSTFEYYEDSAQSGSYTQIRSVVSPGGAWEAYSYLDAASDDTRTGRIRAKFRPFNNAPAAVTFDMDQGETTYFDYALDPFGMPSRPSFIETKVKGIVTGRTTVGYAAPVIVNNMYLVQATRDDQADNSGAALHTITKFYQENTADDFYRNQLHSVQRPDGVKQSFAYQRGTWNGSTFTKSTNNGLDPGSASRIAIIVGTASTGTAYSSYDGYALDTVYLVDGKSTLSVAIRDSRALVVRTESYVWSSGAWQQVAWVNYTYDYCGRPTGRTASNGAVYSAEYNGEQKSAETDASGIRISYVYDVAGRVFQATKQNGPTTTFIYDGANRMLSSSLRGSAPPGPTDEMITASRAFDDAGRLISETAPGPNGPVTTNYAYTYSVSSRQVTVTLPNGGTRVENYQPDGALTQVTGSAVVPQYFNYDVPLSDGVRYARVNFGSSNGSRQRESWSDWLGRATQTSRPGFGGQPAYVEKAFFDASTGRLLKATSTFSSTAVSSTLFQYDALSQVTRSGLDLSSPPNDSLDLASNDRIADRDQYFEYYNSNWWLTRVSKTYPRANDGTPLTVSTTRQRLTGLGTSNSYGTLLAESVAIDVDGVTSTSQTSVNTSTKTVTRTTATSGLSNPRIETTVNGLVVSVTDFDGLTYSTGYDSLQRPTTSTAPRTGTTTTYYKSGSTSVWWVKDAANNAIATYAYDIPNRITTVTDAAGNVSRTEYNYLGQVLHQWGSAAYPVEYGYNALGERTTMKTYRGGSGWDSATWPSGTAGTADVTTWNYDAPSGLLTSKVDAANQTVSYTYNARGQTASRTWARGVTTTYSYFGDASGELQTGELRQKTYSDSTSAVSYTYTRAGQLDTATDGVTGTRSFLYGTQSGSNALQLDAVSMGGFYANRVLTRQYDGLKRGAGFYLGDTSRGLAADLTQTYTYNALGRFDHLDSASAAQSSRTFNYSYNSGGLVSGLTVPGSAFAVVLDYEPNRDLLTKIDSQWSGASRTRYDYTYNALGQRATAKQSSDATAGAFADFGGSTYQRYVYNPRGEVTDAASYLGEDPTSTASPQLSGRHHGYAYDSIGNRQSSTRTAGAGVSDQYTANALNQYTTRENHVVHTAGTAAAGSSVTVTGGSPAPVVGRQGRYWDAQAMLPNTSGPASATLTIAATLAGAGSGGADLVRTETRTALLAAALQSFSYDADGNMTGDGIWTYAYDAENRLVSMSTTLAARDAGFPNRTLDFKYDYLGRRVQKQVFNGTALSGPMSLASARRFLYDGDNLVAEFDAPGGTSCGNLLRSYTWGLDLEDSLTATGGVGALVQLTDHAASTSYFATYDGNGNVASLVNSATGAVAATYEYSPFGELLRCSGSYAASNPFRFSTKFTDDESGLVYYGARYYAPSLGRFINRDPIEEGGGINLYGFAGNDGVNGQDYLGYYPAYFPGSADIIQSAASTGNPYIVAAAVVVTVVAAIVSIFGGHRRTSTPAPPKTIGALPAVNSITGNPIARIVLSGCYGTNGRGNPFVLNLNGSTAESVASSKTGVVSEKVSDNSWVQDFFVWFFGEGSSLPGYIVRETPVGNTVRVIDQGTKDAEEIFQDIEDDEYVLAGLRTAVVVKDATLEAQNVVRGGGKGGAAGKTVAAEKKAVATGQKAAVAGEKSTVAAKNTKWKPGDSPQAPTRTGNKPSDQTVRRREWKNEAENPTRGDFTPEDMERMKQGKPPQRYNPEKPGIESMERSHEPVPKRDGGTQTLPKWPPEHAAVDPNRQLGYPWDKNK